MGFSQSSDLSRGNHDSGLNWQPIRLSLHQHASIYNPTTLWIRAFPLTDVEGKTPPGYFRAILTENAFGSPDVFPQTRFLLADGSCAQILIVSWDGIHPRNDFLLLGCTTYGTQPQLCMQRRYNILSQHGLYVTG